MEKNYLRIIIAIIIFTLFLILLFLILFFYGRSFKSFTKEISETLEDMKANINTNIFSFVIGENYNKENLYKYLLLDCVCTKTTVINKTSYYKNITSIVFVKVNNVVLICPVLQEFLNHQEKCQVYKDITEIFISIFNTNRCFNNIIIQINYNQLYKLDDLNNIQSYIKLICENTGMNIPVYIDFNVLQNIKYSSIFVSNISKRYCLQMFGYQKHEYSFDILNLNNVYKEMDNLLEKITHIIYQTIFSINVYSICIQLIVFIKTLKKLLYQITEYCYSLTKLISNKHQPVFRSFIITGVFNINQQQSYVFISDFINYKLVGESNLIDFSRNYALQGRNKIIETLLVVFFVISTTYLMYISKQYINNSNNTIMLQNNICEAMLVQDLFYAENLIKNTYEINKLNRNKITFNIFELIEIYILGKFYKLDVLNQKIMNCLYTSVYNEIKTKINNYVYFYKEEITNVLQGKFELYIKLIREKYEILKEIKQKHNNLKNSKNVYNDFLELLFFVNNTHNFITQNSVEKLKEIYQFTKLPNKYLENFQYLHVSEDSTTNSVQQVVNKIKEYIDQQNYLQKMRQICDKIVVVVNSDNLSNKIGVLNTLIELYENIKECNIKEVLTYQPCLNTIDYFRSINYISEELASKMKREIIIESNKIITQVREIKHDATGTLIDIYNFKVSTYLDDLMRDLKILYNSDICRTYLLIRKNNIQDKNYRAICIPDNLDLIIRVLENYEQVKNTLPSEKTSYITLGILDQILGKNIQNILHKEFNYFDLQNNSQNFIVKKIIENYNKLSETYTHILDEIVLKNNEVAKEFLRKIFSSYIDNIYNSIISLNIFRENNNVNFDAENFIIASYETDNKDDLLLKIKDNLHKLIKLSKMIKPLINNIYSKKKYVIYTKDLEKLSFINNTVEIIEDYKEDNENNKIYILNKEIIKLFNNEKDKPVKYNREIYNSNNYISYAYSKILDKFQKYNVQKQKYELKQLLKDLKINTNNKSYPFKNAEESVGVATLYEINNFYNKTCNIVKLYKSINNQNLQKKILDSIEILIEYKKIYEKIINPQDINISIVLDDILSRVSRVVIVKQDGEHKEMVAIQDNKSVYLTFTNLSKFTMTIPPIPIPGFKYDSLYTKYLKIKKDIVFRINENFILHAIYLASISGQIDNNKICIDFNIPVTFESVNADKGVIEIENLITNSSLIIKLPDIIINELKSLPDIISKFTRTVENIDYNNF